MSRPDAAAPAPEPAMQTSSDAVGTAEQPGGPALIAPVAGLASFGDPSAEACIDGVCAVPEQT